jgi:hypothetical protein
MNIFDQLLEIHGLLKNDEQWLVFLEDFLIELEVNNIHELIDKVSETEDEDVIHDLINEGEEILLIRESELDNFADWEDLENDWTYED